MNTAEMTAIAKDVIKARIKDEGLACLFSEWEDVAEDDIIQGRDNPDILEGTEGLDEDGDELLDLQMAHNAIYHDTIAAIVLTLQAKMVKTMTAAAKRLLA